MEKYHSTSSGTGQPSGVKGYKYGEDYITVRFNSGIDYTYTYESCGEEDVETMKTLADAQKGLSTYISRNKPSYA